ncbi:polysaccharide biosynthesis/export family protein [Novipirellula sp. SH528]|uniref:polysaccharide biosynthesis/export family protein n=1 Tax=Novipirellula sp. SH528 TaxID=3454466 RepID=UPI003FA072C5
MSQLNTRLFAAPLQMFAAVCLLSGVGCQGLQKSRHASQVSVVPPEVANMPRELAKTVLPDYIIEPPDILTIETVHAVPKSPYSLKVLDVLSIRVQGTLPEGPIGGGYPIEPGGVINLGSPYGVVSVTGLTVPEAQKAIEEHLQKYLKKPEVAVSLAELGASQRLVGQYLVGPDGTVTLGSYGSVSVVGMPLAQAKWTIEQHLSQFLEDPVVSVNVHAFNSKVYYIVLQGAELGDAVYRFPVTGNETVLDAISQINGLEQVSSKKMWIARPSSDLCDCQVLPVDWRAVTECGSANTNFQLMPGDRLFVQEDHMVALDNKLAKMFAPFERMMGFSLLSVGTATRFSGSVLKGGGNPVGTRGGF